MIILNLGCGTKTCSSPEVVNIDWSIYLRLKRNPIGRAVTPHLVGGKRRQRFEALPDNILVHNLAHGIPFDDGSVDVVYHSHLLEHLDREVARDFLIEVKRVLKPGGIQRIVTPDLERVCRQYLQHLALCDQNPNEAALHDGYVAAMLEQSVRRESVGVSQQRPLRRRIERIVLGDARRRGETHQWLYDRVNLGALLVSLGYQAPVVQRFSTSLIPGWKDYGLDIDASGHEYKPGSLYLEART